ncbi:MAG: DUF6391 domain-containing protein [Caldilineaceae bacterium]
MINTIAGVARRTRQHHGLEHATLHLLAARVPNLRMAGLSDPLGFTLFGEADQAKVQRAVSDAMLRLQAGERNLAIHPNCGTNLATSGVMATGAALLARLGRGGPIDLAMRTLVYVIVALVAALPLGRRVQAFTTTGDLAGRWLLGVRTRRLGPLTIHRVVMD